MLGWGPGRRDKELTLCPGVGDQRGVPGKALLQAAFDRVQELCSWRKRKSYSRQWQMHTPQKQGGVRIHGIHGRRIIAKATTHCCASCALHNFRGGQGPRLRCEQHKC